PMPKEQTVEYRLANWIAEKNPVGRVFAFGGVAFRLNSWFDIPQVVGTFESGLRNRIPLHFSYQIRLGIGSPAEFDAQHAVTQLRALRVECVVVTGPGSQGYYHAFRTPWKFDGLLERVYREDDDAIYRLPVTAMAHLVRASELPPEPPIGEKVALLRSYV